MFSKIIFRRNYKKYFNNRYALDNKLGAISYVCFKVIKIALFAYFVVLARLSSIHFKSFLTFTILKLG